MQGGWQHGPRTNFVRLYVRKSAAAQPRFAVLSEGERLERALRCMTSEIGCFSQVALPGWPLRGYQLGPARAIVESIELGLGRSFVATFSRQAGKDELLVQVAAYVLLRNQVRGGSVVIAAPSFRPQAALTRDRLVRRLTSPICGVLGGHKMRLREGYAIEVGEASVRFLSAAPTSNARGQTASLLLVANEAQDIDPDTWDAVFDPMAASTNATTLFLGTVWDRDSLLSRQMRFLEEEQHRDGAQRVWRVPWPEVAACVPAYGARVEARIAQFGADHPFIRTEYCLEELDGAGGLFPAERIAHLNGDHAPLLAAEPGERYALLLDVAGEEEHPTVPGAWQPDARRDSTALTVVRVIAWEGNRPRYEVVHRRAWTGVSHPMLQAQLVDLARNVWKASAVVIDATGIGAGLASFLATALTDRRGGPPVSVVPFIFSAASKSRLGWEFVAMAESGRFKDHRDDGSVLWKTFRSQLAQTTYETPGGPGRPLRWGVPPSRGHDDLVMSAALCVVLDDTDWRPRRARGSA